MFLRPSSVLAGALAALLLLPPLVPTARAQEGLGDMPPGVTNGEAFREDLEKIYDAWRKAMAEGDMRTWQAVMAASRQMEIRNRIVSEKQTWPGPLFQGALPAPSLLDLQRLPIYLKGSTATAVYLGKANFGGDASVAVTDNFIVLRFLQEGTGWKFDNLRIVRFSPELVERVQQGDFSFLHGAEFQPTGVLPVVSKPVLAPDYLGELWLTSIGCVLEVEINGQHHARLDGGSAKELIIGGLKEGQNTITIKTQAAPEAVAAGTAQVEVAVYGARTANQKATRFHHHKTAAGESPQPLLQTSFLVSTARAAAP